MTWRPLAVLFLTCLAVPPPLCSAELPPVDLTGYLPTSDIRIRQDGSRLQMRWPVAAKELGVLTLQLQPGQPLLEELGTAATGDGPVTPILRRVNLTTFLTVGARDLKQGWNVFFDNPPRRPHQTFTATFTPKSVRVVSHGKRATVVLDGLSCGPFTGDLRFTVYPNCRLVHARVVVSTEANATAYLYDMGLTSPEPAASSVAWVDPADRLQRVTADARSKADPVAVRHRAIVAETKAGSVAVFPPPHQYLYPLDFADNFKFTWHGRGFHGHADWGIGIRQPPDGDKRFVPWINAPPKSRQHLSVFFLVSRGKAEQAIDELRRFTHGDRFVALRGHVTFTSHYHIEHTREFLAEQRKQKTDGVPPGLEQPPFVKAFKALGIDAVHLAEFHFRHTPEVNAQRLQLLKTLHDECRRLSDDRFLVLPGEEPNVQLGGHWISFFPKPVYWELHPKPGTPFERHVAGVGTVYAVHSADDVLRLMEKEKGLMWTAHPRIKSSYGFPDKYRDREFYRSDRFLGAAWKAMPADLSHPRLGLRVLDLQDDMANWGQRKVVVGEVDVFQVRPEYELYGHANVNYLRLDKLPRFDDGWPPILDALRNGRFFVTTGEVLLPEFTVGGKASGEVLELGKRTTVEVLARAECTFPPAFAEVIWGDGTKVHRKRIDLGDGSAFAGQSIRTTVGLKGAKWVRVEVWDVAANGAFTPPVWIEGG